MTAVKVVQLKEDELREILLEVEILRDCDQANVVKFMGLFLRNEDLWVSETRIRGGFNDCIPDLYGAVFGRRRGFALSRYGFVWWLGFFLISLFSLKLLHNPSSLIH